jgi:hypothetical protein
VKRHVRRGWRGAIVASILGLWLTLGLAWGAHAAVVFAFFLLVACTYAVWGRLAGHLVRQAGGGYYQRQLDPRRTGHWRDH